MAELSLNLFKLAIGFLCVLAPVAVGIAVLGRRDRRQQLLSTIVLQQLNAPDLRGLFAVSVRSRLFVGDSVSVDLWNCSRDQLWDVMERLANRLPRSVRFEVNGLTDSRTRSDWRLSSIGCRPELCECGACR